MKIAVTGATGFLGRHLVPALLARGVEVVAAGRKPSLIFPAQTSLKLAAMDMENPKEAVAALDNPDVLLHLAWGGLPNYKSNDHMSVELPRQIRFLDECRASGIRNMIVAGTCQEYGLQEGELSEAALPAPTTAYAQAKNLLRQHLLSAAGMEPTCMTWLRIFYVYGPGQAPGSLYSQLHSAVNSGAKSFAMSPGDQLRDFLPVEDAAEQISNISLRNKSYGIVNICSGTPIDVASFARQMLANSRSGVELKLGTLPYPDYEPHSFWGSNEKLVTILRST